ncbi:MAG: GAF domain-containing protein [Armatimonadota bacterium]
MSKNGQADQNVSVADSETAQIVSTLQMLARGITTLRDVNAFMSSALNEATKVVNGHRAFLALVDEDAGKLVIHHVVGHGWTTQRIHKRLDVAQESGRGITGYVAATQKPYYADDVSADPHYLGSFDDVVGEIAVPMLDAYGRTRGVMNVETDHSHPFTTRDVHVITAIADMCEAAYQLHTARSRQQALVRIGNELSACEELEELLNVVLEVTSSLLRFEECSVFIIDDGEKALRLAAATSALKHRRGDAFYQLGEGLTGWVAQNGQPIVTARPHKDPRYKGLFGEMPVEQLGSFMAVPVPGVNRVVGVIRAVRKKSRSRWFDNRFTDTDEALLSSVASQFGVALEKLQMEQKLVYSERMAAWGEVSARSAHMIGNRTFAIKGDLNELEYQLSLPDVNKQEVNDLVSHMRSGVSRLEEILQEFRDFVVATQLARRAVNIADVIRQSVEETFPKRTDIELALTLSEDIPPMNIDAARMRRALGELIENSISFQPNGGRLNVMCELCDGHDVPAVIALNRIRKRVHIRVEDGGPGVPEELKEKIFQPFFTSRNKGMGLGLSIVKGIIDAHRGIIFENGVPGEGARFEIYLPLLPPEDVQ